jgi:hypothetical protein
VYRWEVRLSLNSGVFSLMQLIETWPCRSIKRSSVPECRQNGERVVAVVLMRCWDRHSKITYKEVLVENDVEWRDQRVVQGTGRLILEINIGASANCEATRMSR